MNIGEEHASLATAWHGVAKGRIGDGVEKADRRMLKIS